MDFRVLLVATTILIACGTKPPPNPPPGPQGTGGTPPVPVMSDCKRAGAKLLELQCTNPHDPGTPMWETPEGVPFWTACEEAAADGRDWNPHCIAKISDCSELEAAYRGECD